METIVDSTLTNREPSRERSGLIGERPDKTTELQGIDLSEIDFHDMGEYKNYFLIVNHLLDLQADLIVLCEILYNTDTYFDVDDSKFVGTKLDAKIQKLWTDGADLITRTIQLLKESDGKGMDDDSATVDGMYLGIKRLTQDHIHVRESVFSNIYTANSSKHPEWDQRIKSEYLDAVEASTAKCRKLHDFALAHLAKPSSPNYIFSHGHLSICFD